MEEVKERKFRIVVSSAEEAVRLIRKHLGDKAKVISVKQVEGKGLARFLGSPQLEVIATIQDTKDAQALPPPKVISQSTQIAPTETKTQNKTLTIPQNSNPPIESNFDLNLTYTPKPNEQNQHLPDSKNLLKVLAKSGFDKTFLTQFVSRKNIKEALPLGQGLRQFFESLKNTYDQLPSKTAQNRIAFLGPPATGKTLALCKHLTHDVFVKNKKVNVLRLESDLPKTDEALEVFCKVLGVPVWREGVNDPTLPENEIMYVDHPGIQLADAKEQKQVLQKLDHWKIDTRILVLNALYESEFLDKCISLSTVWNITHLVFTHLDETINACKLWKYFLNGGLTPYFFTYGQSLTSEYTENMFAYLLNKTIDNQNNLF